MHESGTQKGDPRPDDIRRSVAQGIGWKAVSQICGLTTRTVLSVLLARLLGPSAFGVAGMVLVLTSLTVPLSDLGLGISLVQRKSISDVDRSTVFWTTVAFSGALALAGVAASPAIAAFYHSNQVEPLFAVLSVTFLITGLGATHRSLLFRSMDFKSLEIRLMLSGLAGAVAGISLAFAGAGPWSLVGVEIAGASVSTALMWAMSAWRPTASFSLASVRNLAPFGIRYVGASMLTSFNQNADNLLIGRYLGAPALGTYTLAYSAVLVPLARIANPLQEVFYSGFSRIQDDRTSVASMWTRATRVIMALSIPMTILVVATARDAVPAIFGQRWEPAVRVIQILAVVSLLQIYQALQPAILGALNKMQLYVRFLSCSAVINLAAFVLGLRWGIVGVASCFAAATAALTIALTVIVTRTLMLRIVDVAAALAGLWQPTAVLVAIIAAEQQSAFVAEMRTSVRLTTLIVSGSVSYFAVAAWSAHDIFLVARQLLKRFGRHGDDILEAKRVIED